MLVSSLPSLPRQRTLLAGTLKSSQKAACLRRFVFCPICPCLRSASPPPRHRRHLLQCVHRPSSFHAIKTLKQKHQVAPESVLSSGSDRDAAAGQPGQGSRGTQDCQNSSSTAIRWRTSCPRGSIHRNMRSVSFYCSFNTLVQYNRIFSFNPSLK